MKLLFYLRYHTKFGESLLISGNAEEFGMGVASEAIPMSYLDENTWVISLEVKAKKLGQLQYKYYLKTADGLLLPEAGFDREIPSPGSGIQELELIDTWNFMGEFENAFFTIPFAHTLLPQAAAIKTKFSKHPTHIFRVKAPLLKKDQAICMLGNSKSLQDWNQQEPVLMKKQGHWWSAQLDLEEDNFPLAYKYGIYDEVEKNFIHFEQGDNRVIYSRPGQKKCSIIHDGFVHLPNNTWKGTGVAIPVFSLRTKNSFGVGEFSDIIKLVDWTKQAGLRLIQILPVNDTIATHTWKDSYPYAAISAFALHPQYINLDKVAGKDYEILLKSLKRKQKQLNDLPVVDFDEVMKFKWGMLRELFALQKEKCFASEGYKKFFAENNHWLVPYGVFCYLRDKMGTAAFDTWKSYSQFDARDVEKLASKSSRNYAEVAIHFFIQYHLHLQLKEAAAYAHKKGVVLKGDIPIGIYRYSCDAWMDPGLYNMDQQAGAPPDDFAVKGQNWGFPTYNWKKMQEDGFSWWRKRFEQMSHYFDAFRIDHILGFFRIWSIPLESVDGIMGHFVPAIPVDITEFGERGIWFDYFRFCKPYITDAIIENTFGETSVRARTEFLIKNENGQYELEETVSTQHRVKEYFDSLVQSEENKKIENGLMDLLSNIILIEEPYSSGDKFHFRYGIEKLSSFQSLEPHIQQALRTLYLDYFFRRQDDFWRHEAMQKLPYLRQATDMLVCGEDLGMVPACVPEVMKQLGILSLEIQRMPKELTRQFSHPNDAPYLSVVTPSTHDMSTIRGWWEEDRSRTQYFYNTILGQHGEAPMSCEAWINRAIVLQHLYCPAMWSIFQLQDLLGMDENIRRENPADERINVPADPNHYWRYRMHMNLEDLIKQKTFNEELKGYVEHSGRAGAF
jgi:4-alpha-glucanotransferase